MKTYKVVKTGGGGSRNGMYYICVPAPFGKMLHGRQFAFELTAEGIFYRPIEQVPDVEVPAWMRKEPKP